MQKLFADRAIAPLVLILGLMSTGYESQACGWRPQEQAEELKDISQGEKASAHVLPRGNGQRYGHSVPSPISGIEMERYRRYLSLSDEQVHFLHYIYDEYAKKWNALVDEQWAEVDRLNGAAEWFALNGQQNWNSVEPFNASVDAEAKFRDETTENEEDFFAKMEAALTETQREAMWRVRADRQRQRVNVMMWCIRATWLDFSTFVQEELGLTADDLARVDPVLIEYERETSGLREQINKEVLGYLKASHQIAVETNWGTRDNPEAARDMEFQKQKVAERLSLRSESAKLQLELAALQEKYLPIVMEKLSATRADLLLQKQRMTAWPNVYPDVTSPEEAYRTVLRNNSLDAEQRSTLEELWQKYQKGYDQLCKEMCKREEQLDESMAKTSGANMDDYKASIQDWTEQRWEANMRMLQAMKGIVGDRDKESLRLIELEISHIKTYRRWEKAGGPPTP